MRGAVISMLDAAGRQERVPEMAWRAAAGLDSWTVAYDDTTTVGCFGCVTLPIWFVVEVRDPFQDPGVPSPQAGLALARALAQNPANHGDHLH